MGVLGLWQLLAPIGQPVALESLENKTFAVDISIWLNQAVKGYRDAEGGSVPNAHLLSLFSRLCKLLFYKIRPVIVFDGGFPELKKQTILQRQHRRAAVQQNSRDIGLKILTNYLASQNLARLEESPKKTLITPKEKIRDELFALPPLPDPCSTDVSTEDWKFTDFSKEDVRYLNQIDLESEDFNALPPDVKQEILSTLKESRRHRTWQQQLELPKDSDGFSSYQMQCLLQKRSLQQKLEQVQKDLRQMNSADIVAQYTNDHVIGETNKIMSDDCSHYVLLKKIVRKSEEASDSTEQSQMHSSMMETKNAFILDMENIDVARHIDEDSSSLGTLNLKTEIESDNSEWDVDDPLQTSLPEVDNKSEETRPKAESATATNPHGMDSVKQTKSQLSLTSGDVDIERANALSATLESDSKVDETSEMEIVDDKVSPPLNSIESSSDDEMVPCAEVDIDNLYFQTDVSSGNASKSYDSTVPSNKNKDDLDVKDDTQLIKCDISSNCVSTTFESMPSTSHAAAPVWEDSCMPSTSHSQPLSEKEKSEMIARNLQLQKDLESATSLLEADRAKQERQSNTVQAQMVEDCKDLLRLFGVPFVVSPTEAEAQCAFYDAVDLTHGTITDDSDVWLFGGKRVYKNFFAQQKYVEFFQDREIFAHFGLSRRKLVNFALLTGSDYTVGIEGVGPVTAMEILSEFPGEGLEAMVAFKQWWQNREARPPENKVRAKLLKLVLRNEFPEEKIVDAYLNPLVDDSTEKFSWGRPDLDALRDYARERFGWNKSKVDDVLLPVIKKLSERDSQTHIDNFFTVSLRKQKDLFPSKRIMSALKKMTSPQKSSSNLESNARGNKRKTQMDTKKTVPPKRGRKCRNSAPKAVQKAKPQTLLLSEESSEEN